jgi:hypothetical protein
MRGTFDILREGKEFLTNQLGFKNGQNSITLGVKVKADAVYEHSAGSTAQIAGEIYGWVKKRMAESRVQDGVGFVARNPSRKEGEKSFSQTALDDKDAGKKDGGERGGCC